MGKLAFITANAEVREIPVDELRAFLEVSMKNKRIWRDETVSKSIYFETFFSGFPDVIIIVLQAFFRNRSNHYHLGQSCEYVWKNTVIKQ